MSLNMVEKLPMKSEDMFESMKDEKDKKEEMI